MAPQISNPTREVVIVSRDDTEYSGQTVDARVTEIIRGPKGDPGSGSGQASYAHHQTSPASTWNVTHSLGRYAVPVLLLDDDPEHPVVADYDTPSANNTVITLPAPATGWAYF